MLYRFLRKSESISLKCCENGFWLFSFSIFIIPYEFYCENEFDGLKGVSELSKKFEKGIGRVFYFHDTKSVKTSLCPPIGTLGFKRKDFQTRLDFNFDGFDKSYLELLGKYPVLGEIYNKLESCGKGSLILVNKKSNEYIDLSVFCDNRVCDNPGCKEHRLYKYMREHGYQITELSKNMRVPRAWVFSVKRLRYPIDKSYCRFMMKRLYYLLDRDKHEHYGSVSHFSIHMEIKPGYKPGEEGTYFLHFHVVSAGIKNLKLVRSLWGFQIRYERAIKPLNLGFYVSKYASKTPFFPSVESFCEYAQAVYKTQMHRFGFLKSANGGVAVVVEKPVVESDWEFVICSKSVFIPVDALSVGYFVFNYFNDGG